MKLPVLLLLLLTGSTLSSRAAFLAESSIGDFSDDWQNPNRLLLEPGSNFVSGTVAGGDPDLFTIEVPRGLELVELRVAFYNFIIPGNRTFVGFQDGPTLLQDPVLFTADSSTQISFLLFGQVDQDRDVLPSFTASTNASAGPLGPGEYSFWVNEVEPEPATYAFEFVTDFGSSVPEPAISLTLVLSAASLLLRRQRASGQV